MYEKWARFPDGGRARDAVTVGAAIVIEAVLEVVSTLFWSHSESGAVPIVCALMQVSTWKTCPGPRATNAAVAVAVACASVNVTDIAPPPTEKLPMLGTLIGSESETGAMKLALAFAAKASAQAQASAAHAAADRRRTEVPPSSCAGQRVSLERRRAPADAQPFRARPR